MLGLPGMMDDRIAYPEDVPVFKRLLRITWIHIALRVPGTVDWYHLATDHRLQYRLAMLILCITGIASLVPSFFFLRADQSDAVNLDPET